MKITLIGYMGSGKSTIGKILSKKLQLPFYDLDHEIEIYTNLSIVDIFKNKGECYFRKIEHLMLKKILYSKKKYILSVGGGTPMFYNSMQIINQYSESFYLYMNSLNLSHRLKKEKKKRPIINSLSHNQLNKFIKQHLLERNQFYELSKYKIKIKNLQSIDDICNLIIYQINKM